jgi:hypothetical protein
MPWHNNPHLKTAKHHQMAFIPRRVGLEGTLLGELFLLTGDSHE